MKILLAYKYKILILVNIISFSLNSDNNGILLTVLMKNVHYFWAILLWPLYCNRTDY